MNRMCDFKIAIKTVNVLCKLHFLHVSYINFFKISSYPSMQ